MSRIAKNSIKFNSDTSCNFDNGIFTAKGKLGEMKINIKPNFTIKINEHEVSVVPKNDDIKNFKNYLKNCRAILIFPEVYEDHLKANSFHLACKNSLDFLNLKDEGID